MRIEQSVPAAEVMAGDHVFETQMLEWHEVTDVARIGQRGVRIHTEHGEAVFDAARRIRIARHTD